MSNDIEYVRILLKLMKNDGTESLIKNINACDPETGDTPLISALRVGNWEIVCLLMKYGADPMISNKHGEIPAQITSPIRPLFIRDYLSRSSETTNVESLLAVSGSVVESSLKESLSDLSEKLDTLSGLSSRIKNSCESLSKDENMCLVCKTVKATYFHKDCRHLVLCLACFEKKEREFLLKPKEKQCPSCHEPYSKENIVKTEFKRITVEGLVS